MRTTDGQPPLTSLHPPGAPTPVPNGSRVALVIGSGSVKCAAAIGVYRALREAGVGVDMLVGCSGGAIYATLIALGHDAETCAEISTRLWTRELTAVRDRKALFRAAFPRLFGFDEFWGLKNDRRILGALRAALGGRTFADTATRLFVTATDFHTGEQVVLRDGELADAVRASIAIPFAFAPYRVGGRTLIDGFMSDPLPVGVAMREGADVIVAVGFDSPYQSRVSSPARFAFQLSSIMTNNLLRASFAFHGAVHHSEVIPVIPQFEQRVRLFDTAKIPYVIEEGDRAMREQLPYLQRLLAAPRTAPAT
jgi:NTE family protein